MTNWRIPAEPDCARIWVWPHDVTGVIEFRRHGLWHGVVDGVDVALSWPQLLTLGEVSDTHPDLPRHAPLPWTWDDEDGIADRDGWSVKFTDDEVTSFIVRAANAYAERVLAGEAE